MRSLPIRVRLTLLYFVFFAAAGLLLSTTSWLALRHSLRSTAQHELEERADDVETFLNAEPPTIDTQHTRDDLLREYGSKDEGKYLQVVDDKGVVLYFSERRSLGNQLVPYPRIASGPLSFHARQGGLETLLRPMSVHGRTYQIATALAMKKSNALLWSFFRSLLVLTPGLLVLAALAGHLISRKALAPVAGITAAAKDINDRNLSIRLPVSDTPDELSDLSSTLNQMLGRIDAAFSSVRAFTANASHELRTPIALIRTRVEIALCFPRTAKQYQDVLLEVQASTEHMTKMLDSLLRLARADAGAEQLRCEPLELQSLITEVGEEWADTAHRMKLKFNVESRGEPVWIAGDAIALRQLFHILIDNAFRHTPEHGSVDVGLTSSQGIAKVSVTDTGTGIATKDLPHIFERFYRADQADSRSRLRGEKTGAGLGLSLARWIADQHGAKLTVDSIPDFGSAFRFAIVVKEGIILESFSPSKVLPLAT
jgi:heavy metal sensor kinase